VDHEVLADETVAVRGAIRALGTCRVQEEPRCFDAVTRDDNVPRFLKALFSLTVIMHARGSVMAIDLDATDHREIADLGTAFDRARNPGHEHALFGIRAAPYSAETTIDAGVCQVAR
jgi:hypothetical protein